MKWSKESVYQLIDLYREKQMKHFVSEIGDKVDDKQCFLVWTRLNMDILYYIIYEDNGFDKTI